MTINIFLLNVNSNCINLTGQYQFSIKTDQSFKEIQFWSFTLYQEMPNTTFSMQPELHCTCTLKRWRTALKNEVINFHFIINKNIVIFNWKLNKIPHLGLVFSTVFWFPSWLLLFAQVPMYTFATSCRENEIFDLSG